MSKRQIISVQGRGSVSRVSAPPHQLGIQFGTREHVGGKKADKDREKREKKMAKAVVKIRGGA